LITTIKRYFGVIGFISFFLLAGTMGAADLETISFLDSTVGMIVYVTMFGLSVRGFNAMVRLEQQHSEYIRLIVSRKESGRIINQ
jgi:hypothetical protein